MPAITHSCIASWKKFLPDYELRLWNEDTFDVNSIPYAKEAYEARKFAFVADYVRLYALYTYGGIYMDSDVEVLKNLDEFLHLPGFSGFESAVDVPTGLIATQQYNEWAKEQLNYYETRHFKLPDGTYDTTTNVTIISTQMAANGFQLNNTYQVYKNAIHIFPQDYFCAKSRTAVITITENTYSIHHFAGSWQPVRIKIKKFIFHKIVGPKLTDILVKFKRKYYTPLFANN
ncbi:glycosyltransferase [Spirosoma flavus]